MTISSYPWVAAGFLFVAAGLLPAAGRAQVQVQFSDGAVAGVEDGVVVPATRATFRDVNSSIPVQEVRLRRGYYGGYYGAPYGAYYGPRNYARYPRYYDTYYGGYGSRGYGPGYGYYRYGEPYYYGRPYGAARVGPFRVFW